MILKKNSALADEQIQADLAHILHHTLPHWERLRNQRIFMTGGTGFFGCWLVQSFLYANEKLQLNATLTILTRNKNNYAKKYPHLAFHPALTLIEGDVRSFQYPDETFSFIIHAATDASAALNQHDPLLMLDTIMQGTRRVFDFALQCKATDCLLVSSGAVYGTQPAGLSYLDENNLSKPNQLDAHSAYAVGKYIAEHMAALFIKQHQLNIKIARCFAFVGPYLPLDTHFAIGNFILDGLCERPITIKGNGKSYRSYLYAADLAIWLWTILLIGKSGVPYNVGSNQAYSIAELANIVADSFDPKPAIHILQQGDSNVAQSYVPNIDRACHELGLTINIDLETSIKSTKTWYSHQLYE